MPHYKLTYWNGRGAGEPIRQILVIAKQPFEDVRLEREDWPALKPTMPFGQVPVLEEDGKQLAQSCAIARYLARKYGLAGQNPWEEAQVDALADQWKDFFNDIQPYISVVFGAAQGDLDKLKEDVFLPGLRKHLAFYAKAIKTSGSGYLVGASLTYIDLMVAQISATFLEKNAPEIFDEFPEMREHYRKVESQPELKKWIETRPETAF